MTFGDLLDFGAWTLRTDSRELRVAGALAEVEPKVFDLLAYLVAERPRVVSRTELLDRVWGGADVSDNVLARTVMKARKAIGDRADESSMIRTVHRVGYRFAGEPSAHAPALAAGSVGEVRIGLLPFENLSDTEDLGWVEQGLAMLVAQALEDDPRLCVVPNAMVVRALQAVGGIAGEPELQRIARALNLHCLVQTRISRDVATFHLDYATIGSRSSNAKGRLSGPDLTVLGQQLAERIEAMLFPDASTAVSMQSNDAFVNQAMARALQACSEERWQSARKLLEVVLDLAPDSTAAAAEHLSVLAALYDPAVFALGEQLLERARSSGDIRLEAQAHQALGHGHLNIHGPGEAGKHHMERALVLAEGSGAPDWALRVHLTRARHEHLRRNDEQARLLYDRAAKRSEAAGNRVELAKILNNRAVLDAMSGNLLGASQWMEKAYLLSRELQLDSNVMASGGNLATVQAELGFFDRAIALCDELAGGIAAIQDGRMAAGVALTVCSIYANFWDLPKIDALLAALHQRRGGLTVPMAPFVEMARGHRARAAGEYDAAASAMSRALQLIRKQADALMAEQWLPIWVLTMLSAGPRTAAEAALAELRLHPRLAEGDDKRGLLRWAEARLLHANGDIDAARRALGEAVALMPMGRWNALARLDLAWLHVERGDWNAARHALRDIGPWLDEHPLGWLMQCRLRVAHGDWVQAIEWLDRLPPFAPPSVAGLASELRRHCAASAAGDPTTLAATASLVSGL